MTKDGRWIAFHMTQSDRYWTDFCKALGIDELITDPRFDSFDKRKQNSKALIAVIDQVFVAKTRQEWLEILSKRNLIYAPVQDHVDLQSDNQVLENEYIVAVNHPQAGPFKTIGNLVGLSKMPGEVRSTAPELGQHTEEILLEICEYSSDNIGELREKAIIVG